MQKWSQRSSQKNKNKEESQIAKSFWGGKMTFWAVSLQVMKHGSTNTTLKRSGKVHNGSLRISHDQKFPSVKIKSQKNVADFFYIRGCVPYEVVPTGQTTTFTIWKYWKGCVRNLDGSDPNILPTTHESCITKCTSHTALSVMEFLSTKQITVLERPTYSRNRAPSDFFCSPSLRKY